MDRAEPYTQEEAERVRVRGYHWGVRPLAYVYWLSTHMPARTGVPLVLALVGALFGLCVGLIYGCMMTLWWMWGHMPWAYWFVLGAGVALAGRLLVRNAAATERRVRHSLLAKERAASPDEPEGARE